jgi:hypothetical protein
MAPSPATLIAAWEAGAARPTTSRAASLLETLGLLSDGVSLGELTVGQCDARLYALRRSAFGDDLEALSTCPACGEDVEFNLSLAAVAPPTMDGAPDETIVEESGFRVSCRPLRNRDLDALALLQQPEEADVLERCVIEARSLDGDVVDGRFLPAAVGERVIRLAAECDPGAQVVVGLRCPCGGEWADELDIRTILWSELGDWVQRTLGEVHALARFYGWSEAEILTLSPWRRRWYLEASGW